MIEQKTQQQDKIIHSIIYLISQVNYLITTIGKTNLWSRGVFIFIVSFCFIFAPRQTQAQAGMKFPEFAEKLEPYFDNALIMDLKKNLPQTDYSIWGWDVGDFSGDGFYDVAFAVKIRGDKKNRVVIYLFVDVEGYLTQVGEFPYNYVDLPLENGVVIKENTCYLTQKFKQFHWKIKGYTFSYGNLILVDEFETEKISNQTKETYANYKSLISSDKIISNKSNKTVRTAEYLNIPSYPRSNKSFYGVSDEISCSKVDYVPKGAFYWEGEKDLSFKASSSYDDKFLYFTIKVTDDKVIPFTYNDTIKGDCVELWISPSIYKFKGSKEELLKDKEKEQKIIKFTIFPGDFYEIKPYVEIGTNIDLDPRQRLASQSIKASSNFINDGYVVKFKIPFILLGIDQNFFEKPEMSEIKASIVVNDVDNEFFPEQQTKLASSAFNEKDDRTFSTLLLIPQNMYFGENYNVYLDEVIKQLNQYGF